MMRKIGFILCIVVITCLVAGAAAIKIFGRDIPPPRLDDLMPEPQTVPAEENAFPRLMAAADAVALPQDTNALVDYIEGTQIYDSLMADLVARNASALPVIEEALRFSRCRPPVSAAPDYIRKYYRIALFLAVHAVHARTAGRPDESVESVLALLRLGNLLHPCATRLVDINAAASILRVGLNQAADIARMEAISDRDLNRLGALLAELHSLENGLRHAFRIKFKNVIEQIDGFRANGKSIEEVFPDGFLFPYVLRKTTWFPGYMFKENETKQTLAVLYRDTVRNASLDYADMEIYDLTRHFGLQEQSKFSYFGRPNLVGRLFYAFTTPEIDTYLRGKCQMDGAVRATRLIVALQAYLRAHGTLPDRLSVLCPDFIESVPLDPFDGKPFRYDRARAIVYSVSADLKDSGGSTQIPEGKYYGKDYPKTWVAEDAVFRVIT